MSMLQELLNLGLLEIGLDDSRFKKMQDAASSLVSRFGEEPGLLIPATLIVFDEDVDENDSFLELVEGMVMEEWNTLRIMHVNRPRQLLRSIVIDALASTTDQGAEAAGVVLNTAAPLMTHQQCRLGKASGPIKKLLDQAYEKAEAEAVRLAGMSPTPLKRRRKRKWAGELQKLQFDSEIEDTELLEAVARAAGPKTPEGVALSSSNPHSPTAGLPWVNDFSPRMAVALAEAVNIGTSRLAESITRELTTHIVSLEQHLVDKLSAVKALQAETTQASAAGRMRLDVLWWSQARYSPFLKTGYNEVSPPVGALAAAIDVTAIAPPLSPTSVAYVLGEAVSNIYASHENLKPLPLVDYLKDLAEAEPDFGNTLPRAASGDVRIPLAELVAEAVDGSPASKVAIQSRAGLDTDLQLTPAEFAVWIFRDLQAHRLVETLS